MSLKVILYNIQNQLKYSNTKENVVCYILYASEYSLILSSIK